MQRDRSDQYYICLNEMGHVETGHHFDGVDEVDTMSRY